MKKSILKRLQIYMIMFGVFMGVVFPVYANFFVVWKDGMFVYFVIGCMVAGITVGIVSFLFVKLVLIKKLLVVSDIARDISERKIDRTVDIKSEDAVGVIVNGLNSSIVSIRDLILEIKTTSDITRALLVKVKKGNDSNLNFTSIDNSIEVVNSATNTISNHSGEILGAVANSKGAVMSWQERLAITISNVDELIQIMNSLVQNSEKINGIMTVIEGIASKTNLVSLNASIEATHAGEHGKSFTVVSNEIRALAGNVSKSAGSISDYVQLIKSDTEKADKALKSIEDLVRENCKSSNIIQEKLREIETISNSNSSADQSLVSSVNNLNLAFKSIDEVIDALSDNTENLQHIINSYIY